jgi:hypothetical protein
MGHHERLGIGTRTLLVQTVGTLLGVLATTAWARLPSVPRTLGASGGLEAGWASLRTLSDALLGAPRPSCSGVARSSEGSGDRQIPVKKTEWTQEKGKMT